MDVQSFELIGMRFMRSNEQGEGERVTVTAAQAVNRQHFLVLGDDGDTYHVRVRQDYLAISRCLGEPAQGQVVIHRELELL